MEYGMAFTLFIGMVLAFHLGGRIARRYRARHAGRPVAPAKGRAADWYCYFKPTALWGPRPEPAAQRPVQGDHPRTAARPVVRV